MAILQAVFKRHSANERRLYIPKFCHKIGCRDESKKGPDSSNSRNYLPFGEKIVKIGPVDPEIIVIKFKKIKK